MQTVVFGTLMKTYLEINNDNWLYIKSDIKGEVKLNSAEIKVVYLRKPPFGEKGFIYFSTDGTIKDHPLIEQISIEYKKKEDKKIEELLCSLQVINESLKIVYVRRNDLMQKDPAVKEALDSLGCPKCHSLNLQYMGNQRKNFSVGKAVAGGLLTGGVGAVAGFAGKKGQDRWHCQDCGNIFDIQPK